MGEELKPMNQNDHDLLIRISTRFESFEQATARSWENVNEKMSRILIQLEGKADKHDVSMLRKELETMDKRLLVLEKYRIEQDAQRNARINIRNISFKVWAVIVGLISLVGAVINELGKIK